MSTLGRIAVTKVKICTVATASAPPKSEVAYQERLGDTICKLVGRGFGPTNRRRASGRNPASILTCIHPSGISDSEVPVVTG
jgi:hypothetical protein